MSNPETTTLLQSLQSSSQMTTIPTVTEESHTNMIGMSNDNRPLLETGSPLFYGLVAAVSTIIFILLLCVIGVLVLASRRGCKCD